MSITSFSLPTETRQKIDELAKKQRLSKSRVVTEAITNYNRDVVWQEIRKEGDRIAKQLGIESDDDVERIFGRKAKGRL